MQDKTPEEIRREFGEADRKRDEGLTTPQDIIRRNDISYGPNGEWNLLDIYYAKGTHTVKPTIVNIHGGAWVYGTKEVYQFYCMSLAQRGFTVVNFNYRLAPENKYPTPLTDINQVFCFLKEKGAEYYVDTDNLFVVGDSAGAQLASQYLTAYSNPVYAEKFDFSVPNVTIRAVALNCGLYDARRCAEFQLDVPFMAYVGEVNEKLLDSLDVMKYSGKDFPPTFVMSACHDFVLENARPMYENLTEAGVECQLKIYGSEEQEEIAHVFHVNIRFPEAEICNNEECDFFKKYIRIK